MLDPPAVARASGTHGDGGAEPGAPCLPLAGILGQNLPVERINGRHQDTSGSNPLNAFTSCRHRIIAPPTIMAVAVAYNPVFSFPAPSRPQLFVKQHVTILNRSHLRLRPTAAAARRRRIGPRSGRWWLPGGTWLAALLLLAFPALAEPVVSGVRYGIDGPRTRLVLDLDRPVAFRVQSQSGPPRLILDLDEVRWRVSRDAEDRPRGLARAYRFGLLEPGRSRLVVDMARPFTIARAELLPPSVHSAHHRLIVDVAPDTASARAAAADGIPVPLPRPEPAIVAAAVETAAVPALKPESGDGHAAGPAVVPRPKAITAPERPIVVLDPGHGGIDPGAVAVNGAYEKDIVLEMARELRTLLERTGRYRVVLTRDDDSFVPLRDRIMRAREAGGRLFISLHADSIKTAASRGASVYTLSETASDEEAARLAQQENKADILAGADLSHHDAVVATILLDLARRDTSNRSIAFADSLAEELAEVATLLRRHRRFAGFAVLKAPDMPSVLLELGYLSNREEARRLAQADYRAKLAQAIVHALDRYFAAARS
jgi:N-acetylmuramoyl-L-alanine amidase